MRSMHPFTATVLALLVFTAHPALGAAPMTTAESMARATVEGYMAGLISGNTAELSKFITPDFHKERQSLLESPGYGQILLNSYAGATFSISDARETTEGKVEVDAEIHLQDGGMMHVRFLVAPTDGRGYGIDAEY